MKFKYDGIEIEVNKRPEPYEYEVSENNTYMGYNKNPCVNVKFWEFVIKDGDLFELAFVKSVCAFFMQAYWKHSPKDGNKIMLAKNLTHEIVGREYFSSTLSFDAVVGNKISKLRILQKNDEEIVAQIYLTCVEVMMLDIAIGIAINMLAPTNDVEQGEFNCV
jgi:hypothetical protein